MSQINYLNLKLKKLKCKEKIKLKVKVKVEVKHIEKKKRPMKQKISSLRISIKWMSLAILIRKKKGNNSSISGIGLVL